MRGQETNKTPLAHKHRLGLDWLIRLRWIAIAGQLITAVAAVQYFKFALPLGVVAACVAITALSNVVAQRLRTTSGISATTICGVLVVLDPLLLTVMLFWTGGAHNPFTAFYLLHVTIGAILLSSAWSWALTVLCAGCYSVLFASPYVLKGVGNTCCNSFDLHLQGMLLAMILTGACIAYFVSKLSQSLTRRDQELAEARLSSERNERFAALATLAAGMAHELASPLGTIAVASKELEHLQCEACRSGRMPEDARLIRAEVERCRGILEKMANRATGGLDALPRAIALQRIPSLLEEYLKEEHRRRVTYRVCSTEGRVVVPEVPLLQSLAVVIKNGLDASRSDQGVELEISEEPQGATFCIRDNGCGMAQEVASRIGEPFFTTKEPGRGMGLGLFLVRTFVERVCGRFSVESQPTRGTTVRIFIPSQAGDLVA